MACILLHVHSFVKEVEVSPNRCPKQGAGIHPRLRKDGAFCSEFCKVHALRSERQKGMCIMSQGTSSENLINTWVQAQQKLLTNWLDTVKRYSGTHSPDLWTSTVDAWQTSVKQTLDAQEEWMRQWTETLANTQGTPQELQALARQGREQLQRWIDVQRQLWQSWFKIVKDINFKVETGT